MDSLSIPTLRILYKHYVNWVSNHPERTTDLEASIKWISYFLAGIIRMHFNPNFLPKMFELVCRSNEQLDIIVRADLFHVKLHDAI